MSIGLKRGAVMLEPHDAAWDASAQKIIDVLYKALGKDALDIQHVGSTSISGIVAKPIVDIAVGMRNLKDTRRHDATLAEQDILFRKEEYGEQLLYIIGDEASRTHYIHVVIHNGAAWRNYIAFRDYLNASPEAARKYDALKRELAEKHPEDREAYLAGKRELISKLLVEAREWESNNSPDTVKK